MDVPAIGVPAPVIEAIGKGGHFEKIHLCPFVERMVMALGTFHPRAEEDTGCVRHIVEVHSCITDVITRRRVIEHQSVATDEFSHQIVVVGIDSNLLLDPSLVFMAPMYIDPYAKDVSIELEVMGSIASIIRE